MTWIKIEDELPIQKFRVRVKNGKRELPDACYYRKKWHLWDRKLHKVTEWFKCPITYPKIPPKDLRAYLRRAKKYRHQMQPRNFNMGMIRGLLTGRDLQPQSVLDLIKELEENYTT